MADLEPGLAALRDAAAGNVPMVDLTPAEARQRVVAGNRLCVDGPAGPVTDLPPGDGRPVPVRVYEPPGTPSGTLVYAHGGGWVTGDLDYADELCRFVARDAGVRVVSVDYRLAPEHPFPAALDDLAAAWTWASAAYDGPLGLGGDSAGGNLAAALALRATSAPSFLLLVYPVLDLPDSTPSYRTRATAFPIGAADMRWFFTHYVSGHARPEPTPDLAPLRAEHVGDLPPTHLVLAGHDPLHDEGAAFAAALDGAGVEVTVDRHADLCHGFLRFTAASAGARTARSEIVAAVRRLAVAAAVPRRGSQSLTMIQPYPPSSGTPATATTEVNP
ncbi:alpha/beta hydrolase fold domain-containing protein [Nocardioides sp. LHD-245]|uniref:alpha/beta hydrolase fold domain-containing protein n=1 Tax=Nocardioides sp. LHD-245 TaxID=3051387 RepID=UPI0027DFC05A|nr:alpha/beta hydrolase fold domain-containing protein [Nocardioides sp. LHD-245]